MLPTFSLPPLGFVVAMRGTIEGSEGAPRQEWLIASRWGHGGQYLSVARTLVSAVTMAAPPPQLVPRWSTLASLDPSSGASEAPCFTFATQRPSGLMLAGRFAPSRGSVGMAGDARSLRLHGDLHCLLREAWRRLQFDAVRVDWIGEFVEADR